MDLRTRSLLLAPAPLADPAHQLDPVVRVVPGALLAVTTASGRALVGRLTEPVPGVARLELALTGQALAEADAHAADSPMLVVPAAPALPCTATGDGITTEVGGRPLTWGPDGLSWGALTSPLPVHTLTGPAPRLGLLVADGEPVGWLSPYALGADDAAYGGGESFAGPDLRGRVRTCVNVETHGAAGLDLSYLTVPLVWSDAGWGAWAHTGAPVRMDVAATHRAVVAHEVPGPVLDLFLYSDPIRQHQLVTGLPGRLPDWALGVWTSRCSYLSADDVADVLDGYTAADCPVDVVHVDAWPTGNVVKDLTTSWEVDEARWPQGWAKRLEDRGVRLSLWHNPYLLAGTAAGQDALARGLVLRTEDGTPIGTNDMPERLVLDFTSAETRAWWREHVKELLTSQGAVSVKPDFGEEVPPTAVTADGRTGWELRNSYAVLYQRESHSAVAEVTGDDAVALFCRSGTAGAQRYPTHWVGDTPSTWDGMASALRACLSLSLSGFGFATSDVGGFWADGAIEAAEQAFRTFDPSPFAADADPELFLRWTQWGALSPVLRFHGVGRREPWAYPAPYGPLAVEACRMRKQLQPYLCQAAAEASTVGIPMMRPMVLAFPGDRAARDAQLQYLLGPDLLVAPVLAPGGRLRVYVPHGTWTGLAGAPALTGPDWHDVHLDLSAVPAWVRPLTTPLENL